MRFLRVMSEGLVEALALLLPPLRCHLEGWRESSGFRNLDALPTRCRPIPDVQDLTWETAPAVGPGPPGRSLSRWRPFVVGVCFPSGRSQDWSLVPIPSFAFYHGDLMESLDHGDELRARDCGRSCLTT